MRAERRRTAPLETADAGVPQQAEVRAALDRHRPCKGCPIEQQAAGIDLSAPCKPLSHIAAEDLGVTTVLDQIASPVNCPANSARARGTIECQVMRAERRRTAPLETTDAGVPQQAEVRAALDRHRPCKGCPIEQQAAGIDLSTPCKPLSHIAAEGLGVTTVFDQIASARQLPGKLARARGTIECQVMRVERRRTAPLETADAGVPQQAEVRAALDRHRPCKGCPIEQQAAGIDLSTPCKPLSHIAAEGLGVTTVFDQIASARQLPGKLARARGSIECQVMRVERRRTAPIETPRCWSPPEAEVRAALDSHRTCKGCPIEQQAAGIDLSTPCKPLSPHRL